MSYSNCTGAIVEPDLQAMICYEISTMHEAQFRFFGSLNDFLPSPDVQEPFAYLFWGAPAIKDAIEAIGVPHPEVDLILVNGESVGFEHDLRAGDRVSVFPKFYVLDIESLTRVRPQPMQGARFVLDGHLGRLAAYLRMLGFDTLYQSDFLDEELARLTAGEDRILLTRDRGLLKRNEVQHGYCVRQDQPRHQLVEVILRFDLRDRIAPFTRCMRCNHELEATTREDVRMRVPARILHSHRDFHVCPHCMRVYWRGSHHAHMLALIEAVLTESINH